MVVSLMMEGSERIKTMAKKSIESVIDALCESVEAMDIDEKVRVLNVIRKRLHDVSPFAGEPVDFIMWVKSDVVQANDYNPNSVAPPEMELLRLSIENDGYTQPVVTWDRDSHLEVVDGFHRTRVAKEIESVRERIHGYIPVAVVNRTDRGDRIASTIRHNRARGKHAVGAMSDIVIELKRRNWSDTKIGKELGMDPDEVLRLSQISGLAEMFSDRMFSEAWEASDPFDMEEEPDVD